MWQSLYTGGQGVRSLIMADVYRVLGEDEWQLYREVRLAALSDAPEAFVASAQDEASRDEQFWRRRMTRARRIVAERDDEPVGVVGLGPHTGDPDNAEVFGLWTAPAVRGERIAWELVASAAWTAADDGCRLLYFWVGSDNVDAIGFASSFGFRPTEERRPVRRAEREAGSDDQEVAMVLPLVPDPNHTQNPHLR